MVPWRPHLAPTVQKPTTATGRANEAASSDNLPRAFANRADQAVVYSPCSAAMLLIVGPCLGSASEPTNVRLLAHCLCSPDITADGYQGVDLYPLGCVGIPRETLSLC